MEAWLRSRYLGDVAAGQPAHAKSQISNLFQYVTVCTMWGVGVTGEGVIRSWLCGARGALR